MRWRGGNTVELNHDCPSCARASQQVAMATSGLSSIRGWLAAAGSRLPAHQLRIELHERLNDLSALIEKGRY